jgi:hypothetical protein
MTPAGCRLTRHEMGVKEFPNTGNFYPIGEPNRGETQEISLQKSGGVSSHYEAGSFVVE